MEEIVTMRIERNIVIRSAVLEDAPILNKWWNDGRIIEIVGLPNGTGESLEETITSIKRLEGKLSQLCIIDIEVVPVGELNYNISDNNTAYPGWKICNSTYRDKGYGTTIINMMLDFLFTDKAINER